jgi:hypothetical protein
MYRCYIQPYEIPNVINKPTDFNHLETMKKKSTLLTEAIARAKIKQYEEKQKADPLVQAIKRNDKNLRKAWEEFRNK